MNTPLPQRGEFQIELTDETNEKVLINLKFNFQSMARMEERIGYALTKVANEVTSMNMKLKPIVDIFYEGAFEAKSKISYNDLADMIMATGFPGVARQVITVVMKMLVAGKDEIPEGKEVPETETK